MSRGRTPKELRAGSPRKMVRDKLPAAIERPNALEIELNPQTHSLKISMSEEIHRKLQEALKYTVTELTQASYFATIPS